jgi:hypothetical protein
VLAAEPVVQHVDVSLRLTTEDEFPIIVGAIGDAVIRPKDHPSENAEPFAQLFGAL